MKLLFINPCLRLHSKTKYLPVGVASVMTYFKSKGLTFDFLDIDINDMEDQEVEQYLAENTYDIYLSGSIVTHYKWMKWLCNRIKKYQPKSKIIIGNSVAGSIPELFLHNSDADFTICGEGEISAYELVDKIIKGETWEELPGIAFKDDNGAVIVNPKRKAQKKLDDFPMIDWSPFDVEAYFEKSISGAKGVDDKDVKTMPVVTARGCAFRCTFCHFVFWEDPYRYRSPENIISEIRRNIEVYGCNYINFWDDLSFASLPQAERFADAIIDSGLKFNWSAAVRVDLFGNPKHDYSRRLEVAKKFKESGCLSLGFSLESANQEILEMMNKRIEAKFFLDQVKLLDEVKITSMISVVFGYPIETPETIQETFDMCLEAGVYPSMGFLLPLPSTGMYNFAIENGFITNEDAFLDSITERQDLCINMTKMSDDEVKEKIAQGAAILNDKLKLGLAQDKLIRTGGYNNQTRKSKLKKLNRDKNSLILNYGEAEFEADLGLENKAN